MSRRTSSCFIALLVLGALSAALPARADVRSLPILRHLVYRISIGVTGRTEGHREDGLQAVRPATGSLPQGDAMTVALRTHSDGQIVADVVAATLDGGLVVDVHEDAQTRTRRSVRVGIHSNGRLVYPPDADVSEEEGYLLRLLARGIAPSQIEQGATWNVDEDGGDYVWRTNFRAVDVKAPDDVHLEMQSSLIGHNIGGVTMASSGRVEYDPTRVVPLNLQLTSKTRKQNASSLTTTDLAISLDLLEDSFQRR